LTYILDACSLIALYKKEKGLENIRTLFDEAVSGQATIYMHTVNLIEVYYHFCRFFGKEKADVILDNIYKKPIKFIDSIDKTIFSESTRLKAAYNIPLGDSIGLATAVKFNGSFVSGDHADLEKIEKGESVSIYWFR